MKYARARLWTGITGVGVIVAASSAALALRLPERIFARGLEPLDALGALAGLSALIAASLFPLDIIGGFVLPRRHGRKTPRPPAFVARWLRGALIQCTVFTLSAWGILMAGRTGDTPAAVAGFALVMTSLILIQSPLARFVGGMTRSSRSTPRGDVEVLRADDASFTGGLVGWPGRDRVVVPERWVDALGEPGVAAQVARRRQVVSRGWRLQGLAVAVVWNLIGFTLASLAPGASVDHLPGLVTTFCWLNLWSFIGLVTLPWVSRNAVLSADSAAVNAGIAPPVLATILEIIEGLQDDEPDRSAALESIFHPVPSVRRRTESLGNRQAAVWAPWNVARTALYLSWAGFGLLSRAVHCNSGKPELWVLLPCD